MTFNMTSNDFQWSPMTSNDPQWPIMTSNDLKWSTDTILSAPKRFQVKTPCYGAFFQKMHFFINFCVTRVKKVSKRHGLTTVRGLFRYFRTLKASRSKKTAPPSKSFLILFQSYSLFYILTSYLNLSTFHWISIFFSPTTAFSLFLNPFKSFFSFFSSFLSLF